MTPSRIDSLIFTPLNLGKQGIVCRIHGEGRRLSRRYIDTNARGGARDLAAALVDEIAVMCHAAASAAPIGA